MRRLATGTAPLSTFIVGAGEAPAFAGQNGWGVETGDRLRLIARNVAGHLQHQIADAADAEERGEIFYLALRLEQFLVKSGQQVG